MADLCVLFCLCFCVSVLLVVCNFRAIDGNQLTALNPGIFDNLGNLQFL